MTQASQALELARAHGLLRAATARAHGILGVVLARLTDQGELVRLSRGVYMRPDADVSEHHTLAEVACRIPGAVVCLLSALRFHELTTQAPHEVWIAVETRAHRPRPRDLPLRIVEMSCATLRPGSELHEVERVSVPVTSPAKTVADCFRFRSTVGLDVALEALRGYVRQRVGPIDELYEAACLSRVRTVMRPYIEAVA